LKSLNENKIEVTFTHAGIIGPRIGIRMINALTKFKEKQK